MQVPLYLVVRQSEAVIIDGGDRVTRTQKANNRDHVGLANGTAAPEEHLPRYFGKSGHDGVSPTSVKKSGQGRGNWGTPGYTELDDLPYNLNKPKRRSNSTSMAAGHNLFKTKFEADEDVIEYDEDIHGPDHAELEKMSTTSSADTIEEEEQVKEPENK
ncbi:hypothetical protein Slin15195_G120870 [Septoria linicola]|uniref:Hyaluronan/mRNA-binding protein domain-containing protein n=1 Tax=Septoria linicola TaxID=215465 RepID=A0A9Q9B7E0_9PEZI|nr:hypothetical protein Slin15195_G120870 [Septoria linicola]